MRRDRFKHSTVEYHITCDLTNVLDRLMADLCRKDSRNVSVRRWMASERIAPLFFAVPCGLMQPLPQTQERFPK